MGDHIRLIVYLDEDIVPQMRPRIEQKIKDFGDVEKVIFKTRKDAYAQLKDQLGEDNDVLADLSPSFLPPSIEIYPAKNLKSIASIKQFSDYLATLPNAQKVQYGKEWIERLSSITQLTRIIVLLSGGLVVLTATFMVSSTIRLTVVTRHAELEILRLLGATKGYIQVPLVLEGVLQGILGAVNGLGCLYILYFWIQTKFSGPSFLNIFSFTFMPIQAVAFILIASITLCTLGSIISIRKFLRI